MKNESVFHLNDIPFAFPVGEDTLRIRLRTARGSAVECTVFYKDRYDWGTPFLPVPMEMACRTELFDYYEADLRLKTARFQYFFSLKDKDGAVFYYNERGFWQEKPKEVGAFQFPYIAQADLYHATKWAQEGICYQIFPQSFCNGDPTNDPADALPWGAPVTKNAFYGGDLKGILDRLPYLTELGVTFLYLTPVFLSNTPHKYNTDDYMRVDPHFGDNETLKRLVEQCHNNGIRVILDAVFNHCGENFFAFQDVVKNGEKSNYKDWFFLDGFPVDLQKVNYVTFADGVRNMPKLNTSNPEVQDYLLSVAEYWMREVGIDGWRLDVCDEVSHAFWRRFRSRMKSINPEAIMMGEIHHQCGAFLRGDELDGIMNYPLYDAVLDYFAKRSISGERFADEIAAKRMLHPDVINRNMLNLLDSHDTERFLTSCGGRESSLKLAEVFQFTYIGIPYVYYGDEVGLSGGTEPACRACMQWDPAKQNRELLEFFRKLAELRKENRVLVYGGYRQLKASELFAYERTCGRDRIVVLLNNGDTAAAVGEGELCGGYDDLWNGGRVTVNSETVLEPGSFRILRSREESASAATL
jgi:cyclomaltodextrinase